ncbi:hypothetical protein [Olleya sp. R77988]|uniref:hypothetical protein n=1 Tax=Olleya sp. R77988 TaxID=3093875 RepID=UPI0037C9C0D8
MQLLENDTFVKRIQYLIITLFILLIAFDVYLAIDNTIDNDTISYIIKSYTDNGLYILTFFWGAVTANFFFPTQHTLLVSGTIGSIILVVFAIFIYWFSLGTMVSKLIGPTENDIRIAHAIYMVFGFIMGYLFWRQPDKSE